MQQGPSGKPVPLSSFFAVSRSAFVRTVQEGRAKRALGALQELSRPTARVIRDGREKQIGAWRLRKET